MKNLFQDLCAIYLRLRITGVLYIGRVEGDTLFYLQ